MLSFANGGEMLENKAHLKGQTVQKYGALGLCILVAIPLPGTGAWTGALAAVLLDMRLKKALPSIAMPVNTKNRTFQKLNPFTKIVYSCTVSSTRKFCDC